MAKKQETKKATDKKNGELKNQLEVFFTPWQIKKWKSTKNKVNFTIELTDSIKSKEPSRELNVYQLSKDEKNDYLVNSSDLNNWSKSNIPILLLIVEDNKLFYLAYTEHFITSLFSENPARSSGDLILISKSKFTQLSKTKLKDVREFCFKWKKIQYTVLESGTYFRIKDSLRDILKGTINEIEPLGVSVDCRILNEFIEEINRAIYTVAIVGPTKAGKSTIINSLVSKNVSPINIRPTTGIPTNIVPGKEEKSEILLKTGEIISGSPSSDFLNQFVSIDQNRSNYKGVKMVTVWVRSDQMEKGISFCDFPGLDDADPIIEKTVANALQFVNAIIYVIDASGMQNGFKFPKQYRDDLLSLKNKDRIFLVINKVDDFTDESIYRDFKLFIDEQLELLQLKEFLPIPPIYMEAKKSFEQRQKGIYENDSMKFLEEQIWDHLLANNKSGLHNLLNIINQVSQESERLCRVLNTRLLNGDKQKELKDNLQLTEQELGKIKNFEARERQKMQRWLYNTLLTEKEFLIGHYKSHLKNLSLNKSLPNYKETQNYLMEQFTFTAPDIFEKLENEITKLNNDLNNWVNSKLQSVEITIDKYSKNHFKNSDAFNQMIQPIANIFSETYGKNVPTNMFGNILYHIFNTVDNFSDWLWEIFTNKQVVRDKKINTILSKLEKCYNEVFEIMYTIFLNHLNHKCNELLGKVTDRTSIYLSGLNKQISLLNNPLTESEKKLHALACDKLISLDNECGLVKLQIEDYSQHIKAKPSESIQASNKDIDVIELELRKCINNIIVKNTGKSVGKEVVPSHILPKVEERIRKHLRDHPNLKQENFATLESHLSFFDLSEYFDIVASKPHWDYFSSTFNNKDNLQKHTNQLGNFRNGIRHSRDLTPLVIAEGEASILWFKMALKIKLN